MDKEALQLEEGQEVFYLPDIHHALRPDRNGEYPWLVGVKRNMPDHRGKAVEFVKEFTDKELTQHLIECKRSPDPAYAIKSLMLIRPIKKWKGIVKSVNEDGTVNLEHECSNSGVTLYSPNVSVDLTEKTPHSCHPRSKSTIRASINEGTEE